ncbi:helix-turn-helix domain-containing protein [Butyrivibrio sp. AE3004]|uniref:helix-turn-helix domain-containing protein n=1 Tax=Butyrivibrio sp. AE3004 TaxID=1506994 RepID=UPI00068F218B|nr:helix-turn-helix domain-containing protein [Butyrivibrio sp. AE3004]
MAPTSFYQRKYKKYSKELKEKAVLEYINGEGSLLSICQKYGIRAKSKLQNWIKKYNDHEELKASETGGVTIMTKGRKTTFDERVEIVQYCISHDCNYAETAERFKVSYQQARNYTVKYKADGIEALKDRRGRTKSKEEMTELDRLRAENRILRAEKERAEMEAAFLKKLDAIERGWD